MLPFQMWLFSLLLFTFSAATLKVDSWWEQY